jgi:predicted dehydrogenase
MRVGIVGCGHIANQHLHQLKSMQDIELVGVCDLNKERAEFVAKRFNITNVYQHFSMFLRDCSPQVVHVLTPPQFHKKLALEAMESGCHVLIEKPMAMNAEEAHAMVSSSQLYGVCLGVCHNFLFVPAFVAARKLIDSGKIGRILSAEVFWKVTSFGTGNRTWIPQWISDLPGGIFHEIAPHPIYLLQAIQGKLEIISAVAKKMKKDLPYNADELKVLLNSESGPCVMSISVGTQPVQKFIRVYGSELTLHIDLATSTLLKLRSYGSGETARALLNVDQALQMIAKTAINAILYTIGKLPRGHEGLIAHFYKRLSKGDHSEINGQKGLMTVSILDSIWSKLELISQQNA